MATATATTVLVRRLTNWALPACMALMDACWIYIVAWLLATQVLYKVIALAPPSPVLLALLELLSLWVASRLFVRTRLSEAAVQLVSGVVGFAICVLAVLLTNLPLPAVIDARWIVSVAYSVVACLVLWYLGGYRATDPPDFNQAYAMFRIGLAAIGVCAVVVAIIARESGSGVWAGVGGAVLGFFAFGLAALALGNREVVRKEAGAQSTGSWSAILLVSVGAILLVGTLAGAFSTGGLQAVVEGILVGILFVVGWAAYLVTYLFVLVASIFNPQFKYKDPKSSEPPDASPPMGSLDSRVHQVTSQFGIFRGAPEWLVSLLLFAGIVLVVALAIWLVSRGVRRSTRIKKDEALEEREQLGSWALFVRQVRQWLMSLFRRKGSQSGISGGQVDELAALAGKPEWSGTLTVRQIYARLQKLAAVAGYSRGPQQTPLEYLRVLQSAMPNLRSDFAAITAAYIEARYGPMPASGSAVYAAQQAWKRAEPALQAASAEVASVQKPKK